ncbi:MAG: DUF429 domain-containing protein [Candidatus Fermentibacteraceae bacterium]|nr:DUF429 domain-containing protein [Candidatus Fermentibacteraceae bacterium]MBN2607873.1 DUF429 domain-containing protein [Candidatus Fermentibacteraceae bacterium]
MSEEQSFSIIGIDCATQPARTGLVCARYHNRKIDLVSNINAGDIDEYSPLPDYRWYPLAKQCQNWIRDDERVLFCMDSPLGWPNTMREVLPRHNAGELLGVEARDLFNRATDLFVDETIQKRPLEIGANLIARTAAAALELLTTLRVLLRMDLPLLWQQGPPEKSGVIEVYPVATIIGRIGTGTKLNFKTKSDILLPILEMDFGLESIDLLAKSDDHMLDAAMCVLAGADFIEKRCHQPLDLEAVRREGWIWFSS